MTSSITFRSIHPIGDTRINALPVRALGPAIGYYTLVLGFTLISKEKERAILKRDSVEIGLSQSKEDPEQASCYFDVSDVDELHKEYESKGIEPTPVQFQEHEGKPFRIFFVGEPYGVCLVFGQPA